MVLAWLTAGLIAKYVAASGFVAFMSFIYEEALQTQGFNVKAAITAKNWDEARRQNELLRGMVTALSIWNGTVGWINPASKIVFDSIIIADTEQVNLYEDLINRKDPAAPEWVNNFAGKEYIAGEQDVGYRPTPPPEVFTSRVDEVIDGDTLIVKQDLGDFPTQITIGAETYTITAYPYIIRFVGLDAPEAWTKAGEAAKTYLISRLLGVEVTVKVDPTQVYGKYGRVLGVVYLNDENINATLITQGYAAPAYAVTHKYFTPEQMREAAAVSLALAEAVPVKIKPPEYTTTKKAYGERGKEVITRESPEYRAKRTKKLVQYRYKDTETAAKKDHDVITDEETLYEESEETKVRTTQEQPRTDETTRVKSYGVPEAVPAPIRIVNAEITSVIADSTKLY